MDLIKDLGTMALATRFKRLSERFSQDVARLYRDDVHLDFEPRWFPVYFALTRYPSMSVMDLADAVGLTHPAVTQIADELIRQGLIEQERDPNDKRRRVLRLSEQGKAWQPCLETFWQDVHHATERLAQATGYDVLNVIERIEEQLAMRDFYSRVQDEIKISQQEAVEIIDYTPELKPYFESLNREWLTTYFSVEPADEALFADPEGLILKPGGDILFARYQGDIVGTCALMRHPDGVIELGKVTVTEKVRGLQIGKKLMLTAIERAKDKGATTIFLESNSKLTPALRLFRTLGFTTIPQVADSKYRRADVRMKLDLASEPAVV